MTQNYTNYAIKLCFIGSWHQLQNTFSSLNKLFTCFYSMTNFASNKITRHHFRKLNKISQKIGECMKMNDDNIRHTHTIRIHTLTKIRFQWIEFPYILWLFLSRIPNWPQIFHSMDMENWNVYSWESRQNASCRTHTYNNYERFSGTEFGLWFTLVKHFRFWQCRFCFKKIENEPNYTLLHCYSCVLPEARTNEPNFWFIALLNLLNKIFPKLMTIFQFYCCCCLGLFSLGLTFYCFSFPRLLALFLSLSLPFLVSLHCKLLLLEPYSNDKFCQCNISAV